MLGGDACSVVPNFEWVPSRLPILSTFFSFTSAPPPLQFLTQLDSLAAASPKGVDIVGKGINDWSRKILVWICMVCRFAAGLGAQCAEDDMFWAVRGGVVEFLSPIIDYLHHGL
ncbi:hypothetical protein BDV93DRAFT_83751 [Ceratobasidium sp. AG-I]|nr:hypothetical protein BDV93DRAFT_83751 [Ceratobasidium sp. AG-I]